MISECFHAKRNRLNASMVSEFLCFDFSIITVNVVLIFQLDV